MYTPLKLSQSLLSHSSVSSINILITTQQYLSGVKRKTSVSAPSIMCSIFLFFFLALVVGGLSLLRRSSQKPFPQNLAGIWLWGRWVSFRQEEEGGMCSLWEGMYVLKGRRWCIALGAKLSLTLTGWEMCKWCKHAVSWWKHASQAEIVELSWKVVEGWRGWAGVITATTLNFWKSSVRLQGFRLHNQACFSNEILHLK